MAAYMPCISRIPVSSREGCQARWNESLSLFRILDSVDLGLFSEPHEEQEQGTQTMLLIQSKHARLPIDSHHHRRHKEALVYSICSIALKDDSKDENSRGRKAPMVSMGNSKRVSQQRSGLQRIAKSSKIQ